MSTSSLTYSGRECHVCITLGTLQSVRPHTSIDATDPQLDIRFAHAVLHMSACHAVLLQRELLQALAAATPQPDVSGAVADLGEAS